MIRIRRLWACSRHIAMQRDHARKASDHDDHYQSVAKVYSMAVFYDLKGPFVKWLKERLSEVMA